MDACPIGANEATQLYVLPPVFAEFRARYPDVRLRLHRNFTRKLVERVLANTLDFAVVSLPVDEKDLVAFPLHKDELVVVAPPGHPLTHHRAVTIEQVAEHPQIFPRTGRTRVLFRPRLRQPGTPEAEHLARTRQQRSDQEVRGRRCPEFR